MINGYSAQIAWVDITIFESDLDTSMYRIFELEDPAGTSGMHLFVPKYTFDERQYHRRIDGLRRRQIIDRRLNQDPIEDAKEEGRLY